MQLPSDGPKDFEFSHSLPAGPFVDSIRVGWGDADPAQIAYTGNIPAWGLRAIEAWIRQCTGVGWYEMNMDLGVGTPFVELRNTFHAPITPRHTLDSAVLVSRIGRSSLALRVEGRQQDVHCYSGHYVCAFVDAVRMRPIAIPPRMRANIRRYAGRQGAPFEDAHPPG